MDSWFNKELEKLGENKPAPIKSFRPRIQPNDQEKSSQRNPMLQNSKQNNTLDSIENDLISYNKNKEFNFFTKKEKKPVTIKIKKKEES